MTDGDSVNVLTRNVLSRTLRISSHLAALKPKFSPTICVFRAILAEKSGQTM
jgi:hypothetical protein